jgi:hypothetical protein
MKRSEMLNEIYKMLFAGSDYPHEEDLLNKIEELGMLPPKREIKIVSGSALIGDLSYSRNDWEPEDEEESPNQ